MSIFIVPVSNSGPWSIQASLIQNFFNEVYSRSDLSSRSRALIHDTRQFEIFCSTLAQVWSGLAAPLFRQTSHANYRDAVDDQKGLLKKPFNDTSVTSSFVSSFGSVETALKHKLVARKKYLKKYKIVFNFLGYSFFLWRMLQV